MYAHSSFPDPVLLRCCFPQLCPIVLRAHCKFPKHFPIVLRAQSSIAIPPNPVQLFCVPSPVLLFSPNPVQLFCVPSPVLLFPLNPVQLFYVPSPVLLFSPNPVPVFCVPSPVLLFFPNPVPLFCLPTSVSLNPVLLFCVPTPVLLFFPDPVPHLQEANLLSRCFAPQTKMCDLGSHCVMTETNCTSYPCMASPTCIREFRLTVLKTPQFVYCLILFRCSTCSVSAVPLLHVLLARCTQRLHISRSFILLFLT